MLGGLGVKGHAIDMQLHEVLTESQGRSEEVGAQKHGHCSLVGEADSFIHPCSPGVYKYLQPGF